MTPEVQIYFYFWLMLVSAYSTSPLERLIILSDVTCPRLIFPPKPALPITAVRISQWKSNHVTLLFRAFKSPLQEKPRY